MKFARELKEPAFAPREVLAGTDARQLAREPLAMSQEECSAMFKNSPMKRAKLRGLKRNAAVVLGNVGTTHDIGVLTLALGDADPLVREHARWALAAMGEFAARSEARAATALILPRSPLRPDELLESR